MKHTHFYRLNRGRILSMLILTIVACTGCTPYESLSDGAVGLDGTSGGAGVFDNTLLIFNCYVKNANTSKPISGAVVEWDRVGDWPGSIVYPTSGTTDANGYFSVQFTFPSGHTYWNLHLTRAYSPNGGYYAWSTGATVALKENSPQTVTIYLKPL